MSGGGQYYRNLIFLLFLLSSTASLLSQDKNQSSLYLGTIEIGSGISKDRETKIRNGITINLNQKYKEKFLIIDDETVKNLLARLKIQQQAGCSTEKCERMIDDALNADLKITGSLTMESSKLQLTLKLFRFRDMEPSLENQVEKTFAQSQFELASYIKNSLNHELKNQHKRIKL
jgi:citrate lyase gamma subunit